MIFPLLPLAQGQFDGEARGQSGELQGADYGGTGDLNPHINKEDDVSSDEPDDRGKISETGKSTISKPSTIIIIITPYY